MSYTSEPTSKTFVFEDEFNYNITHKCETTIKVTDKISNNTPVYVIDYEHRILGNDVNYIINSSSNVVKPCPFAYHSEGTKQGYEGVIVVKNEMTSAMVKMLMMDDTELEKYTGLRDARGYRSNIMVHITHFWD